MQTPRSVKLSESAVDMRPHGPAEFTQLDFNRIVTGEMTFLWDPSLDGVYGGEGFHELTPDQPGEGHLDSDEVLYLISTARTGPKAEGCDRMSERKAVPAAASPTCR